MQKIISLPNGELPVLLDLTGSVDELRVRVRFISSRPELIDQYLGDEVEDFSSFGGEWVFSPAQVSTPEAWEGEMAYADLDSQEKVILLPSDIPPILAEAIAELFRQDPELLWEVVDEGVEEMVQNLDRLEAMHERRIADYESQIEQVRSDLSSVKDEKSRWLAIPDSLPGRPSRGE